MNRLFAAGRYFFSISIIAFGIQNLIWARLAGPVMPIIPWLPANPWLTYLTGAAFLAAGVCMMLNLRAKAAAISLGILFLIFEVAFLVPRAVVKPLDLSLRTVVFEVLTLCAGAFLLAGGLPGEDSSEAWERGVERLSQVSRYLLAVSSLVFGLSHFLVPEFIASLIPRWIPGPGLFWAYFTGTAFVATGLSLTVHWLSRWAVAMQGVMLLVYFVVLHVPRVLSPDKSHNPAEWSSAFIALGICGGSWIAAAVLAPQPAVKLSPVLVRQS